MVVEAEEEEEEVVVVVKAAAAGGVGVSVVVVGGMHLALAPQRSSNEAWIPCFLNVYFILSPQRVMATSFIQLLASAIPPLRRPVRRPVDNPVPIESLLFSLDITFRCAL